MSSPALLDSPTRISDTAELEPEDIPRPFFDHLEDLQRCLLRALAGLGIAVAACYTLFPRILKLLLRPPVDKLVYTSPTEPFFAHCKLALIGGILVSFPWILYQAWRFISPGLKPRERRVLFNLIPAAYALCLLGGAFGLFVAAPLGLKFLMSYSSAQLIPYLTLSAYLGYLSYMTLGLALLFQLPLLLFALALLGMVRASSLAGYRRHVLLGLLVLAAVITPSPDIYGQILIALPTYVLFEISLLAMRLQGPINPD